MVERASRLLDLAVGDLLLPVRAELPDAALADLAQGEPPACPTCSAAEAG